MWRALCSLLLLLPLMLGCGEEEAITPPNLAADVEALRLVMIQDPAHQPLEEMERVAQDRPYEAARLLRTGVIPAAERQLARAEAVSVRTDEGGQLKRRLARAYRDRVGALRDYREVLEDGARDPDALMAALRAQSSADRAVLDVDAEMERLVSTAPSPPVNRPTEEAPGDGDDEAQDSPREPQGPRLPRR